MSGTRPPDKSLLPQQFFYDSLTTPGKLYVGVPTASAPTGKLLILDTVNVANKVPLAGGTMTGPLILSADPLNNLGAVTKQYVDAKVIAAGLPLTGGTITGMLKVINDPTVPFDIITTVRDPLVETITNEVLTNLILTKPNAQDILSFTARMHVDTGGNAFTSQHSPAIYGEGSAVDSVTGGSALWISGVQGVSGNNGKGAVINACDFLGHPVVNTAGGTVTNHYILFGPGSVPGRSANEYGFSMPAPSGIGTATPVAWFEVRGPDALATTRLTRVRNSAGSVLDIMGDQSIGWFGAVPVTKRTVTGAWAGNAAGKALCVALAQYGFIVDSTTA